jgi:hypothetical protein
MFYPWEQGEKPYFVNPEGFEWYYDHSSTQYAQKDVALYGGQTRKGLKNVVAFYVKKGDEISSVLINKEQEIIVEHTHAIGLCVRIDVLKVWEDYASQEDRDTKDERKAYIKELSSFGEEKIKPMKLYSTNEKIF